MPFKSERQRRWMYENNPEMAKRWEKHTKKGKKLPEKAKSLLEMLNETFTKLLATRKTNR